MPENDGENSSSDGTVVVDAEVLEEAQTADVSMPSSADTAQLDAEPNVNQVNPTQGEKRHKPLINTGWLIASYGGYFQCFYF